MTASSSGSVEVVGTTYINVEHPDFGGDVQAAIDSVSAGTIYVPGSSSSRAMSASIDLPAKVSLQGDGPLASVLDWGTTIGAGEWAVRNSSSIGTYNENTIRDLGLTGPAFGNSLTMGSASTNMHGLRLGRRTVVNRCNVQGFNYGIGFQADHSYLSHCTVTNNHFNVAWLNNASHGDQNIDSCLLDGASMASLTVEDGAYIDSCNFAGSHLGYAPYGIYAADGRVTTTLLSNSSFIDTSCEQIGNAWIRGSTTDQVTNVYFGPGSGNSQGNSYKISATTYDYLIDVGIINDCIFDNPLAFPIANIPGTAWINSSGNGIGGLRFRNLSNSLWGLGTARPFLRFANGTGAANICEWQTKDARGRFLKTAADVTRGQAVKVTGRDNCSLYSTSDQAAGAGVAQVTTSNGANVPVAHSGYVATCVAEGTVPTGVYITPGTSTAGRVKDASATTGVILGYCVSGNTDGNTIQAFLFQGGFQT